MMQQLPISLLKSLMNLKGFNKEAFERVHASGEQVTSIRFNPAKTFTSVDSQLTTDKRQIENIGLPGWDSFPDSRLTSQVPWSTNGYYLSARPSFTFDPLFHAGTYYVQEASSMFLEQAIKQTVDLSQPLHVLDLCAAPGGKSTLIQSLMSGQSLLLSNEVIKARVNVLE